MNLQNFFTAEHVIKIDSTEKQPAIRELVSGLQEAGLIENKDRYYAQVAHRESLENTGIGNMLAIPHARSDSVEKFYTILGMCETPVDYQAFDGKPVKYIMLSLFPTGFSTKYLYLIGMMARIFNNKENAQYLKHKHTNSEIYDFLNKQAEIYFTSISEKTKQKESGDKPLAGVPSSDLDLLIRLDRLYNLNSEQSDSLIIVQKIDELKKLIDNRSLTYYERMRKKNNNPFSVVEKNSCAGCHMEIPPLNIKKIQDRDGIHICTYCGRFLILL